MKKILKWAFVPFLIIAIAFGQSTTSRFLDQLTALTLIAGSSLQEIVFGNIPDRTGVTMFCHNPDLDTGGFENVRHLSDTASPIRSSASTLSVVSSDATDDSGSTGANIIRIEGVDSDYLAIYEDVVMNGISAVVTTKTFRGVNRSQVLLSGTGRKNSGNITITHTGDSVVESYIAAGESVSDFCRYTMPANKQGYIENLHLNAAKPAAGSDPEVLWRLYVYSPFTNTQYTILDEAIPTSDVARVFPSTKLEPLRAKETIWLNASTTVNDTIATGRINIILAPWR